MKSVGKKPGIAKNLTHRSRYRFLSYLLTSSQVFRIPVRIDLLNLLFFSGSVSTFLVHDPGSSASFILMSGDPDLHWNKYAGSGTVLKLIRDSPADRKAYPPFLTRYFLDKYFFLLYASVSYLFIYAFGFVWIRNTYQEELPDNNFRFCKIITLKEFFMQMKWNLHTGYSGRKKRIAQPFFTSPTSAKK